MAAKKAGKIGGKKMEGQNGFFCGRSKVDMIKEHKVDKGVFTHSVTKGPCFDITQCLKNYRKSRMQQF